MVVLNYLKSESPQFVLRGLRGIVPCRKGNDGELWLAGRDFNTFHRRVHGQFLGWRLLWVEGTSKIVKPVRGSLQAAIAEPTHGAAHPEFPAAC